LKKYAAALKPKRLVPIHSEFPQQFHTYFDSVQQISDSTVIDI